MYAISLRRIVLAVSMLAPVVIPALALAAV